MADLCYAFNNPEVSDLLLVFTACHTGEQRMQEEDEVHAPQVSFFAHQVVLQQSELYRTKQSYLLQQQQRGGAAVAGQQRLEIEVEPELLETAETVTRFMYGGALPKGPLIFLVRAYRLAHFLRLPTCMAACVKALDNIQDRDEGLDEGVLRAVYSLPEWLLECEDIKPLLSKWCTSAAHMFGNVLAIVADNVALEQFCRLPYPGVLTWLKADFLEVHNENDVLLMLCQWVRANAGCSEKQLEELAHNVRVMHLSPSYLHTVLPILGMFRKEMGKLPFLLARRELAQRQPPGSSEWDRHRGGLPLGWVRPARRGAAHVHEMLVLDQQPVMCLVPPEIHWLELEGRALEAVHELEAVRSPTRLYSHGFYIRTYVQVEAVGAGGEVEGEGAEGRRWVLKAGVKCDAESMCRHFGETDAEALVNNVAVSITLGCRTKLGRLWSDKRNEIANVVATPRGYGWLVGADRASDTIRGAVAPFLEGGRLRLGFNFNRVE